MKITDQLTPTVFTILGGAGELTRQKLVPALFNLFQNNHLPVNFSIVIADRLEIQTEKLRKLLHEGVNKHSRNGKVSVHSWNQFALRIYYLKGDLLNPESYTAFKKFYKTQEKEWNQSFQTIFYMAIPSEMFIETAKNLNISGLISDRQKTRVVVEKPAGKDLSSVMEMNRGLGEHIREQQLFRIDHHMNKETFQNILALRFANPIFEPLWNRHHIDYIAITAADVNGIGNNGNYYDQSGALRDMVPGYLMQLLCLITMEPMVSIDANEIRNKMIDVLHNVQPFSFENVDNLAVRGQYEKGRLGGRDVLGYREEMGISSDSETETFVAIKLLIDSWRWHEVPFYIRTGKRLARQVSEIVIQFKGVPHKVFPFEAISDWLPARLILSIIPDLGISLRFLAKQPGLKVQLKPVDMRFSYHDGFSMPLADTYESLLWDILRNDQTLFVRSDQIEAAWRIISPVQKAWTESHGKIPFYSTGSWGPKSVQKLFIHKEHQWPEPIVLADYYQRIYKS